MIVLDTHAWIWWVSDPDRLSESAAQVIGESEAIGVSAISCWEVGMLSVNGRVAFDRDVRRWVRQALAQPGLIALPLTPKIGVEAAALGDEFPGDPADRMIYATARETGWPLVTRDRRIRSFDPRGTLW